MRKSESWWHRPACPKRVSGSDPSSQLASLPCHLFTVYKTLSFLAGANAIKSPHVLGTRTNNNNNILETRTNNNNVLDCRTNNNSVLETRTNNNNALETRTNNCSCNVTCHSSAAKEMRVVSLSCQHVKKNRASRIKTLLGWWAGHESTCPGARLGDEKSQPEASVHSRFD